MTYVSKRPDRARQAEARAAMRGRRAFALRMGMRTGKSKVLVDDFGEMADAGAAVDLLVDAPGGVYRTWPDHVRADLSDELASRTKIFSWDSDRARTKSFASERDEFAGYRGGPRVLVVNNEALSSVAAARELCLDFLRQRPGRNVAAVDESVIMKNGDSICGRFVAGGLAPLAAYRRILTGLIAPRSPIDLHNQFKFLDPRILGHPEVSTFRARYVRTRQVCMLPSTRLYAMLRGRLGLGRYLTPSELRLRVKVLAPDLDPSGMVDAEMREFLAGACDGGVGRDAAVTAIKALGGYVQTVPVVEGFENLEELRNKIAPHSYACSLEDCYDMPRSDYSFRDVPWHPEQRRVYEELRANATAELASMDHVTATHVIVRMLRLHQVLCGHVVDDEERRVHDVPERRTAELLSLLADYDGKAIVWCSYQHSVRRVAAALAGEYGPESVAAFWGGNAKTREAEEAGFKSDPRRRFMVATPDAGGRGRDWSVADLCVFYSSRNNLDHRAQAEDRPKADGKTRAIAYVDLRVPGTVEDRIIRCLREKIDMFAAIDGADFREWLV